MSDRQALWDKAASYKSCMLVTQAAGQLRARPMAPMLDREKGEVYFLTSRLGLKDDEIEASSEVCLTFAGDSDEFLSISGVAELSADHALIVSLWGPHAEPYFERGLNDPNIVVIIVRPTRGEIWQGAKTVSTLFGTASRGPRATTVELVQPEGKNAGPDGGGDQAPAPALRSKNSA